MNRAEARSLLLAYVQRFRGRSYDELRGLIGAPLNERVLGPSGARYQIEIQAHWDDRAGGDLRVLVSIDDGGLSAFHPMTEGFILSSDGTFVGE